MFINVFCGSLCPNMVIHMAHGFLHTLTQILCMCVFVCVHVEKSEHSWVPNSVIYLFALSLIQRLSLQGNHAIFFRKQ